MTAEALLRALAAGEPIDTPMALVVAHPDDETLGPGSRLAGFSDLTLIHLTDGAPADVGHARRAGFETREAYAAARVRELDAALAAVGARPKRRLAYGLADQGLLDALPALVDRLAQDLAGRTAVLTHAYEGGHPDHDTAALAVARACVRLGGAAPVRLEFAGYFGRDGVLQANRFHSDSNRPEVRAAFTREERARKTAAFEAFASQGDILANFPIGEERYRQAPDYDFTAAPPCGEPLYDRYGWEMTGAMWRARASD